MPREIETTDNSYSVSYEQVKLRSSQFKKSGLAQLKIEDGPERLGMVLEKAELQGLVDFWEDHGLIERRVKVVEKYQPAETSSMFSTDQTQKRVDEYEAQLPVVNAIVAAVCEVFEISLAELVSTKRTKSVSLGRRVLCYMLKNHTTLSTPQIGRLIKKDHSTVVVCSQQVDREMAGDIVIFATTAGRVSKSWEVRKSVNYIKQKAKLA